jgi:hypothetical protein
MTFADMRRLTVAGATVLLVHLCGPQVEHDPAERGPVAPLHHQPAPARAARLHAPQRVGAVDRPLQRAVPGVRVPHAVPRALGLPRKGARAGERLQVRAEAAALKHGHPKDVHGFRALWERAELAARSLGERHGSNSADRNNVVGARSNGRIGGNRHLPVL